MVVRGDVSDCCEDVSSFRFAVSPSRGGRELKLGCCQHVTKSFPFVEEHHSSPMSPRTPEDFDSLAHVKRRRELIEHESILLVSLGPFSDGFCCRDE